MVSEGMDDVFGLAVSLNFVSKTPAMYSTIWNSPNCVPVDEMTPDVVGTFLGILL